MGGTLALVASPRELTHAETRRTIAVPLWRAWLFACSGIGVVRRWIEPRTATLVILLAPAALFTIQSQVELAVGALGLWVVLLLAIARRAARDRLIVGDFTWYAEDQAEAENAKGVPPVRLGNLLLVELSRLSDLFKVVGDRRAVSSGLANQRALDATLSVDDLVENLQGTFTAETKANIGPLTLPVAPFVTLFGRLVQAPRLTGNLHRDGDVLILTAQLSRDGMSWRVQRPEPEDPTDEEDDLPDEDDDLIDGAMSSEEDVEIVISNMVEELALRVYTDLALGRAVRWQASSCFVEGLKSFRSCLRTPKERKFHLKRAEQQFLSALAEDEDFPLVYYNLGVVYTELHGLAVTGGRTIEAETRLSAAEASFGRAIEKDPTRREAYFAFAQTQFRYSHWDSAIELCEYIADNIGRDTVGRAKTLDLWARSLMKRYEEHGRPEDYRDAVAKARDASRLALRALASSRRRSVPAPRGEESPESRCAELASACLLTFSDIYSRQMPPADELASWGRQRVTQERIRRNAGALAELAPVNQGRAEVRFDFGRRLLDLGHLEEAEEELAAAVQSDPTRPSYAAGLALARARLLTHGDREVDPAQRGEIIGLCLRALQGLAGAFFPSRDPAACRIVADAYSCLAAAKPESDRESDEDADEPTDDAAIAAQLRQVAEKVDAELKKRVDGAAVSSVFLEVLQESQIELAKKVGEYGQETRRARSFLEAGRAASDKGQRDTAHTAFREALAPAERATSLNPLSTLAWETLGDVHAELLDFQNARRAWKKALTTDPDNPRLYDRIGSSYWHIAFQGRARVSRRDLERAAEYFTRALLLYGSGSFREQTLTHYRLGKLYAALREFPKARRHIEIVEAMDEKPPLVGWCALGFAHLEARSFLECEDYFGKVVRGGKRLADESKGLPDDKRVVPSKPVGDRLDEQHWPFALVRAWGHLGLAITHAERDGDLAKALENVEAADELLETLGLEPETAASDERFPSRAPAAALECRGLILLREGNPEKAIAPLKAAVNSYPHSRAYFELGLALEQRAATSPETRKQDLVRAQRLFEHGRSLSKASELPAGIGAAADRVAHGVTDAATVA